MPPAVIRYMPARIARSVPSTQRFHSNAIAARTPANGTTTPSRFAMRSERVIFGELSTYGGEPTAPNTINPPAVGTLHASLASFGSMCAEVLLPGMAVVEHTFDVPLDHADPAGERITVFARELADPGGRDRPLLVYLQGGPGIEAPRPTRQPSAPGWLERALRDYRVLMLDQRGTGRSSPVGALPGRTPAQQADYLAHFRADSIVRDAEWIRAELGVERWSVLGQSFGGLCVITYLSLAPDGLREALVTGGIPALGPRIDDVYARTYERVLDRNRRYYDRYPADRERVLALHDRIQNDELRLPCGDRLTWRRFRQLGQMLGMSDGAEHLHYIVELPPDSPAFLHDVETAVGFARDPIYAVLHEASWADGGTTRW